MSLHHVQVEHERPLLSGKRVVICEDEGVIQLQLRHTLLRSGMTVVGTASTGDKAVELVLARQPDIVLMDIQMPVMDGIEASRRILAELRTCIVIVSAYVDRAEQMLGLASGFVAKPVSDSMLLGVMEKAWLHFQQGHES